MLQILRHGIDISRHHLKGVYVCMIGKDRKQPPHSIAEVICTLRETNQEIIPYSDISPGDGGNDPITLTYQDMHVTLRPWDPYTCVIAAAIRNRLIHFPIKPGSGVLMLGCSLQTLSHIADIIGPSGRLIGVIDAHQEKRPTSEEFRKFFKYHPGVHVVTEDVQQASLERYERLLSLPLSSKYAFLMALHPRLGAESPAGKLSEAEDSKAIMRRIFSFVEGGDALAIKCLVVCHWPPNTRVDVIRSVVLSHIDILQRWRASKKTEPGAKLELEKDCSDDEDAKDTDIADRTTSEPDAANAGSRKKDSKSKDSKGEQDSVPLWVFVDLPTHHVIINNPNPNMNHKLLEVVDDLKRLASGLRTGLLAKEQLLLTPYFPNHALLLLKYVAHRDACGGVPSKKKMAAPPGLASGSAADSPSGPQRPPGIGALPMPSFATKFGVPAPDGGSGGLGGGGLGGGGPGGGGGGGGSASKKAEAAASSSGAACSSAATPAVVGPPGLSVLAGGASGSAPCSAAVASSASGGGPSQQKSQQAANKAARKPAAVRLEMYDNEQQAPQGLPVGLVGGDQNAIALAGDVGGGINDYSMVAAGNRGLPGSQGGCLPVQRHASMPPGGAGMLMPRSKGQGGMDNSRAAAGLPGRHPMMHGGMPGAVDHYGGLNPVDLPPGPCGLPDRGAQMWGGPQQVGPPGHMPPPGLWGGDYSQEPLPVGPASRGWGQQQPNYLGHYGGKGSGPGHGQLGKGPGNMMGGWHDVQGAQGGAPGLAPGGPMQPNMDQLQYMPMSF